MIQRAEHNDNFTRLTNDLIRDTRLSAEAFRLLCFMLSCSDEWTFSVRGLAFGLNWSERKTKQYVSELKKLGYIEQVLQTDTKGRFLPNLWIIHEEPKTAGHKNRTADKPRDGETARRSDRTTGEPHDGKIAPIRTINIKERTNSKNEQRKEESERFIRPTLEEVASYCEERKNNVDPQRFIDYYTANGWKVGRNPMKDWKAAVRTWERGGKPAGHCQPKDEPEEIDWDEMARELEEKYRREGKPT